MTQHERTPQRHQQPSAASRSPAPPQQRTTPRQALWSCLVAVAVVFILGILFYGINAAENRSIAASTHTAPTNISAGATASSKAQNTPGTTGQGGTTNQGTASGTAAH
jgi:hypothetical protein